MNTASYDAVKRYMYPPEMFCVEVELLQFMLLNQAQLSVGKRLNILEYGSGLGTIHFTQFLEKQNILFDWYSMEHFKPFGQFI